jgi:hypothetical protein
MLPAGPLFSRLVAKDCRKLVSEALELLSLLLPPSALTRLEKLVCRLESAVEVLLLVVELSEELPDSSDIRLCRSVASWPGPLLEEEALVLPVALVLLVPLVAVLELVPSEVCCACSAAIRLCMKACMAAPTSVELELEDVADEESEEEVDDVESVEVLSVEPVAVVADVSPTPIDCNACMRAPITPPSDGGGGGAVPEVLDVDDVEEVPALDCAAVMDESHGRYERAELEIELTLMMTVSSRVA